MKIISILIILFLPLAVQAEGKWHTSTIKRVYPLANGGFVLTFEKDSSDCNQSVVGKYHYVTIGENSMTLEGSNKLYSLALMAAATEKSVNIFFDDATSSCFVNRMSIDL